MMRYRVKDWDKHYEVSDSKKVDGPLSWVAVRTKQDGFGFRRMVQERDRCELLAAWLLIVEIAARQRRADRGTLMRDGRPLTPKSLATMTGFPESVFNRALSFFSEPEQDWLVAEDIPQQPAVPAASARAEGAPGDSALAAESSEAIRTGPDSSEPSGSTGQDTTLQNNSSCPDSAPPHPDGEKFVDWFLDLIEETGGKKPKLTASSRASWADCYDKLLRLDGRTKEQVKDICRWARNDEFWRKNFLSPMKLREKKDGISWFDHLHNRMAQSGNSGGRGGAGQSMARIPSNLR